MVTSVHFLNCVAVSTIFLYIFKSSQNCQYTKVKVSVQVAIEHSIIWEEIDYEDSNHLLIHISMNVQVSIKIWKLAINIKIFLPIFHNMMWKSFLFYFAENFQFASELSFLSW